MWRQLLNKILLSKGYFRGIMVPTRVGRRSIRRMCPSRHSAGGGGGGGGGIALLPHSLPQFSWNRNAPESSPEFPLRTERLLSTAEIDRFRFSVSRGFFFPFAFAGLAEYGKRDFCHGSKLTELSMRGSYLATESSHDTSCCVGSLNNSEITVKECTCRTQRAQVRVSKHIMGHAV